MPEYLAPGVFVEEIDGGSKPIEGVGTSTAAFVGYAKSGEFNKPTFISSWSDFCRIFGEDDEAILGALAKEYGKSVVEMLTAKRTARKTLVDYAAGVIAANARAGVGSVKSLRELADKYNLQLDGSPYLDDSYLAYAVKGFYDNDGGRAYIVRIARPDDLDFIKTPPRAASARAATLELGGLSLKALESGPDGNAATAEVGHEGEGFTVKLTKGDVTETYGTKEKPLGTGNLKDVFSKSRIATATAADVKERPKVGTFAFAGGAAASSVNLPAVPLTNEIAKVAANDFIGDEAKRSGIGSLSLIDDINFICVPDLMVGLFRREAVEGAELGPEALVIDENRKQEIIDAQALLVSYCERMADRMCILDPIPGLTPQEMRDTVLDAPFVCERGQAAIYYPWIKVTDELNRPGGKRYQKLVPPCGHMAGVWARTSVKYGEHKAPANEGVMGALGLEQEITKGEQEILNPNGINCIRAFPGMGIRVWGARTLATVGNPSWKYINVRRLFNFLEKSMERGLMWAVFEPNDQDLWGRVRRTLNSFLLVQWRDGKLFGETPDTAFYVKCDAETNPQEMIDQGRMYVEVGINPVKPAEFVIVRMGQWTGGASITES